MVIFIKGVAMMDELRHWFRLVVDFNDDLSDWNDWSEDGLRRYWTAVRASILLGLLVSFHHPFRPASRHKKGFICWAILWLSNPEGKAVPHV